MGDSRKASATVAIAFVLVGCTTDRPIPTPTKSPTPSTILSIDAASDLHCTIKGGKATITVKRLDPKVIYRVTVHAGLVKEGAPSIYLFPAVQSDAKGFKQWTFPCRGLKEGQYDVVVTDGLNDGKDSFDVFRDR